MAYSGITVSSREGRNSVQISEALNRVKSQGGWRWPERPSTVKAQHCIILMLAMVVFRYSFSVCQRNESGTVSQSGQVFEKRIV